MKTKQLLICKTLIFIVSFIIICSLLFMISCKTHAAEITTNIDDNSYTLTIFDPNQNRNISIVVKWIKTDLRPELVPAEYFNSSNLTAHETPHMLTDRTNATVTINGGCWYVAGENINKPWGTTGINGTCYSALYDYVNGQDVTDLTAQTLVLYSSGQLNAIEINSADEYVTKYQEGKADWAVYGKYTIINDGAVCTTGLPVDYAPRSFIAQDYNGYYYIGVTESKDSSVLYTGPSYTELANFIINNISSNIRFAYALDGGGSSALYNQNTRANIVIESTGERAVSNCICFYATGWLKNNNDWYYYNSNHVPETGWKYINNTWYYLSPSNGRMYSNEWLEYNGNWYYFVNSGAMATGWLELSDGWHYFGTDGHGTAGWRQINDKWYYFSNSGVMYDSEWLYYNEKWYYLKAGGAMATGWLQLGSKWYYLGTDGDAAIGQRYINNNWYCFHDNCAMYCNEWLESYGSWYYFGSSGAKLYGWQQIDGKWHYMSADTGAGVTGFNNLVWNGQLHLYHFNSSGVMTTNSWIQSGNNWLYFTGNGAAAVGLTTINGYEYYFNSSGIMQTGWILVNGEYMYFDPSTGRHIPDGTW